MNSKRLLLLADHLDTIPKKKFYMEDWTNDKCGTAGCAMFHACSIPSFKKAGLMLAPKNGLFNGPYPKFDGASGMFAAVYLFDISIDDAQDLFDVTGYPNAHPTPKEVAKHIRMYVKEHAVQS